jgi:hypothetical protein
MANEEEIMTRMTAVQRMYLLNPDCSQSHVSALISR